MAYTYAYPRPALTVDVVLLRPTEAGPEVLLIQRRHAPFEGRWALPGGFVEPDEPLEAAARRELAEETGLRGMALHQVAAFGDPGRDPRGWTVSVAFWGWVGTHPTPRAGDDASDARWWPVRDLPPLAFDHAAIIAAALKAAGWSEG